MTDSSMFDPNSFLDAETTVAFSKRPPIPASTELLGVIGEPKVLAFPGQKDPTKKYYKINIPIQLDLTSVPEVQKQLQTDTITLIDSQWLDIDEDTQKLDERAGRNRGLFKYREATGLNEDGVAFNPRMLQGRTVKVTIGQREGRDGETMDTIASVGKP